MKMDAILAAQDKAAIQEQIVTNFVSLLGSNVSAASSGGVTSLAGVTTSAPFDEFLACLSDAVQDSDVVCTIPSLEMPSQGKKGEADYPLPKVGETHKGAVPEMAASVLDSAVDKSSNVPKLEAATAQQMSTLTSWTKSTLVYAPQAACKSVSSSFSKLVDSRVRAWTLLLLRHSLNRGDDVSRSCLLSMLSSTIEMHSALTTLKTLPLPDAAKMQPKVADVILPVLYEATLEITVQGRHDTVTLRAPGTVSGT